MIRIKVNKKIDLDFLKYSELDQNDPKVTQLIKTQMCSHIGELIYSHFKDQFKVTQTDDYNYLFDLEVVVMDRDEYLKMKNE